MLNRTLLLLAAALSCAAVSPAFGANAASANEPKPAVATLHARNDAKLTVTSTSFENNGVISDVYTQNGQNKSPELSWSAGPPAPNPMSC